MTNVPCKINFQTADLKARSDSYRSYLVKIHAEIKSVICKTFYFSKIVLYFFSVIIEFRRPSAIIFRIIIHHFFLYANESISINIRVHIIIKRPSAIIFRLLLVFNPSEFQQLRIFKKLKSFHYSTSACTR